MKRQLRTLAAILLLLWGAPSARAAENKPPSPARNSLSRARLIATNLVADVVNVVLGTEPRALAGLPIGPALLVYLGSRRVRAFFRIPRADRLAF